MYHCSLFEIESARFSFLKMVQHGSALWNILNVMTRKEPGSLLWKLECGLKGICVYLWVHYLWGDNFVNRQLLMWRDGTKGPKGSLAHTSFKLLDDIFLSFLVINVML